MHFAAVVGGSATAATATTLHSRRAGGLASVLAGVILMGWIEGEMLISSRAALGRSVWRECSWATGRLDFIGVGDLKRALTELTDRPEVDSERIGAVGFCLGGTYAITWACTDNRLQAIAPYYGSAPRRREAIRRMCPVVGSWPDKDFTTGAAATLETELTAAGIPHDLKVYPGTKHGFFNDQSKIYDAAAAEDSWQRVLAFFGEHIRGGSIDV